MIDIQVTTVSRDLYYHEVAYVRGLEKSNAELVAALEEARPYVEKHVIWSLGELKEPAILLVAEIDAALAAAGHKQGGGE